MNVKALLAVLLLAIAAGSALFIYNTRQANQHADTTGVIQNHPASVQTTESGTSSEAATGSTFSVTDNTTQLNTNTPAVDVTKVGLDPLTDDEYRQLQSELHNDESLLLSLIEEYRNNTNPQRAKQLTALLGEHNIPAILDVAAELIYSGDPVSQKLGLDLLSRLQPHNTVARDMAIELLSTETDPSMLVSTMNVLATPAGNASAVQHELLLNNTTLLARHENANVRSHSIELIGRWNQNAGVDTLTSAITDEHPQVRARAVSALRGIDDPSTTLVGSLLTIAEDTNELKTTRQSALYTLRNMPLTVVDQQRYEQAQLSVRTRQLPTQ